MKSTIHWLLLSLNTRSLLVRHWATATGARSRLAAAQNLTCWNAGLPHTARRCNSWGCLLFYFLCLLYNQKPLVLVKIIRIFYFIIHQTKTIQCNSSTKVRAANIAVWAYLQYVLQLCKLLSDFHTNFCISFLSNNCEVWMPFSLNYIMERFTLVQLFEVLFWVQEKLTCWIISFY